MDMFFNASENAKFSSWPKFGSWDVYCSGN